ncbi:hypothetical protein [Lutibaculum baratangense]|uniref:Uncharacterized protein n=1 Tax=Lutibaculum baratangense AMV1 TaxID=631454 RepID=V4RK65_9HYPH|nr:hypothetical protein [Lutibaculum baratangense]ESR25724.1 hypothetical protein N177_1557 [Lutibaculum baratangense AMV1]
MMEGQILWAVVGIGVIIMGIVIAYGMMRNRRRSPELHQKSEEATRRLYREESR